MTKLFHYSLFASYVVIFCVVASLTLDGNPAKNVAAILFFGQLMFAIGFPHVLYVNNIAPFCFLRFQSMGFMRCVAGLFIIITPVIASAFIYATASLLDQVFGGTFKNTGLSAVQYVILALTASLIWDVWHHGLKFYKNNKSA